MVRRLKQRMPEVGSLMVRPVVSLMANDMRRLPVMRSVRGFLQSTKREPMTMSLSAMASISAGTYSGRCCLSASN